MIVAEDVQQIGSPEDLIKPRRAFQCRDLFEQHLVVAGDIDALAHERLAFVRERSDLYGGIDDGNEQRHCDQ